MALCSNDLKSCYDRINHTFASLCLQRQGLHKSEVTCMFDTLQTMTHRVRTAYGDSTQSFGGTNWTQWCSSIYQGNGAGPIIWAAVSSPLLEALRHQGYRSYFRSALSNEDIWFAGYKFVDDMDLVQTGVTVDEAVEQVATRMQNSLNQWRELVGVSGGALNIKKCTWWLVEFRWNPDGSWKYAPTNQTPATLEAQDFDGLVKTIQHNPTDTAFETLGVKLAPTGNEDAAKEALEIKANKWADSIRASSLRHHEAMPALRTTILKTLEYPLPVISLSESESRKLMKPVLYSGLSKAGLVWCFNRKLLYGPKSHLGLEIHDLYTTLIIAHAEFFAKHAPLNTMTGTLIRAAMRL